MTQFHSSMPLADLVTLLTRTHHAALRAALPRLSAMTAEVLSQPGPHQTALRQSAELLANFEVEMLAHLDHESRSSFR